MSRPSARRRSLWVAQRVAEDPDEDEEFYEDLYDQRERNRRRAEADGDYQDYYCSYCPNEWRVVGNGGLVLGCWPNCPECGTPAKKR